jgi:hypothetical protein
VQGIQAVTLFGLTNRVSIISRYRPKRAGEALLRGAEALAALIATVATLRLKELIRTISISNGDSVVLAGYVGKRSPVLGIGVASKTAMSGVTANCCLL